MQKLNYLPTFFRFLFGQMTDTHNIDAKASGQGSQCRIGTRKGSRDNPDCKENQHCIS